MRKKLFCIGVVFILSVLVACDNGKTKVETETIIRDVIEKNTVTPTLQVEEIKAKRGSVAKVKINIKNNPGILGMKFSVYFDEEALSINKVDNGVAFKDILTFTKSKYLVSGSNYIWDGMDIQNSDIKDGTVLEIEFMINKDTPAGKYPITIVCGKSDAVDNDLNLIEFVIIDNYIEVTK